MTFDADDVHCDSLSGTSIAPHALSMRPILRPARRSLRFKFVAGAAGAAVLAGTLVTYAHHYRDAPVPQALRVEGQTVSYSSGFAASAGIRTMELRMTAFSPVIVGVGKTTFDPLLIASVGASALGTVRRVAKYEGDSVKRGEVLAEIGSPLQARIDAAAAVRARELPRGTLGVFKVRSPLDGVVVERRIVTGQSVRGERVVFVIADPDHLALELLLDEPQGRAFKAGDRVELSRETAPGVLSSARVVEVVTHGDAGESKVLVRVGIDNRDHGLRPGQAVNAKIFASTGARVLLVPNRALAWIGGRPTVFVSHGHNLASAEDVTLGGCDGEQTEVRVGLSSGQRIVSDGVRNLRDASFL